MERKEAIEIIKKNYPDSSFTMLREALETLIPELKENEESESEKIRNTIFDCLYKCCDSGVITREQRYICIAWLEKQGEHSNFLSKIQVGDKVTLNEDGVLVNLTQLKRVVNKGIENAIKAKRGEQKPQGKSALEAINEEKVDNANKVKPKFKVGDWVVQGCNILKIR